MSHFSYFYSPVWLWLKNFEDQIVIRFLPINNGDKTETIAPVNVSPEQHGLKGWGEKPFHLQVHSPFSAQTFTSWLQNINKYIF